jgi:ABC-type glycerol-3-phosphate transport system substrate-binding protein
LCQRIILLLVVALLLSACLPAPLPIAPTPSANEQTRTVITFAEQRTNSSRYEALIAQFEAVNPDIAVQFVPRDNNVLALSNAAQVAAVADTAVVNVIDPAATSVLLDIGPLRDADAGFDRDDFWPGAGDGCTADERAFGLPVVVAPSFLFYDGAAFDAAGIARPQVGWTWNAFEQAVRGLTERSGSNTTRYGFVSLAGATALLAPRIEAALLAGGDQQAALVDALNWYVVLARDGFVAQANDPDAATQIETLVEQRQAAIWLEPSSNLEIRRSALGPEVALAPFPVMSANMPQRSTPATVLCATISPGSQHPQAAWRWISFLSTQNLSNDWRVVPARPSVADSTQHWDKADEAFRPILRAAMQNGLFTRQPPATFDAIETALGQVRAGSDLKAALAQVSFNAPPTVITAGTPVVVATPEPIAPSEVTTVKFLADFNVNAATMRQVAQQFNRENPQIRVQVSTLFEVNTGNQGFAIEQAAQAFDCFVWNGLASPAAQSQLYDLRPLFDADTTIPSGDFDQNQINANTQNGALYNLPLISQPTVVRYNADLLAAKGISPPTSEWTRQDFEQIIAAAASGQGTEPVYGLLIQRGDPLLTLLALRGAVPFQGTPQLPTAQFTSPAMQDAATYLARLARDGVIPPLDGNEDLTETLRTGRVAMWIGVAGDRSETVQPDGTTAELPFTVGTATVPTGIAPLTSPPGSGFFISRRAADPAPCWTWMKYLSSQPDVLSALPIRRSVFESAAYQQNIGPDVAAVYRAALAQPTASFRAGYPVFWLRQALQDVIGGASPETVLDEAQQKADAFHACVTALDGSEQASVTCAKQVDPTISE